MTCAEPLLTVAVPTYNRAAYLDLCLGKLVAQASEEGDAVEIVVSDNASDDGTQSVIQKYRSAWPALRAVRNGENIGSDRNIAQCFGLARGRYVLIFGDDDVLLPGALPRILRVLKTGAHGVVFLKPYGYDEDFNREYPRTIRTGCTIYSDSERFVRKVHVYCTFISANIINKTLAAGVDLDRAIGTNLVQVRLFYRAALHAASNVYFQDYMVAAKRNNSGGYNYLRVFVVSLNEALEAASADGLSSSTRRAIQRTVIFRHLPYYVLRMRRSDPQFDGEQAHRMLLRHYPGSLLYWLCLYPIVKAPLMLALAWTWGLIFASRAAAGEVGRMFTFVSSRLRGKAA